METDLLLSPASKEGALIVYALLLGVVLLMVVSMVSAIFEPKQRP